MNTAQAKKIPLQEILARLGFQPVKTFRGGEELAFLSPFREEKEPSLFVNTRKNVWNDFGDIGGNALDFVIRYRNTDVKGSLEFLNQLFGKGFVHAPQPLKTNMAIELPKENTFLLASTKPFGENSKALFQYITVERRINPEIAAKYLKEVHFTHRETGKQYFAAGFENLSGGYEIRNPFFKSSIGTKDMSFVKGGGDGKEVWVFEGFMDFLSKLTLDHSEVPLSDCLILNSVTYVDKATAFLLTKNVQSIIGFLDNDKAGSKATEMINIGTFGCFFDARGPFYQVKDLNEFLTYKNKNGERPM